METKVEEMERMNAKELEDKLLSILLKYEQFPAPMIAIPKIKQLILDLIGEDEHCGKTISCEQCLINDSIRTGCYFYDQNELRSELRRIVKGEK
jgi:hypothetical protein